MPQDKLHKVQLFFRVGSAALVASGLGAALIGNWWLCFAALCQVFGVAMLRRAFLERM